MKLSNEQIGQYNDAGYLLIHDVFTSEEVNSIVAEMNKVVAGDGPEKILEKNGSLRSFFAPEAKSEFFTRLFRTGRLVQPSSQLVGADVYIHQSKLNTKAAMVGDWWDWHRDYTFWKLDDGMPRPDVLTAMIYLNDAVEYNGPLLLIPGSHLAEDAHDEVNDSDSLVTYPEGKTYLRALTADLKYTLKRKSVADWLMKNGIFSAKATAGSVLFFHGNIFHASSNNMSPWDRHTCLITYNSVHNAIPIREKMRPEFIAGRNFTPLCPVDDLTF